MANHAEKRDYMETVAFFYTRSLFLWFTIVINCNCCVSEQLSSLHEERVWFLVKEDN